MQSIPSYSELRHLVEVHALEIAALTDGGEIEDDAVLSHRLMEFKDRYQPLLVDRVFTAIFRTYSSWLVTALSNKFEPGSATYAPPVLVVEIESGAEIARLNRLRLSQNLLEQYQAQIRTLAQACALELARNAKAGVAPEPTMQKYYRLAAELDLDFGLTEQESAENKDLLAEYCTQELGAAFKAVV